MTPGEHAFGDRKPLIGMIHLPALPGAPNYANRDVDSIAQAACADARALQAGGLDGLLLQNANDRPPRRLVPRATVAAYAVVAAAVRRTTDLPLGINVLKSDAEAALAIAVAVGAAFVRLKGYVGAEIGAEGIVQGCAAEAIRLRRELGATGRVEIWADAIQPTSVPLSRLSPAQLATWCVEFGEADRVIVTARSLNDTLEIIGDIRGTMGAPIVCGGGVDLATAHAALDASDGLIVGRPLRRGSLIEPVDAERARAFVAAARG